MHELTAPTADVTVEKSERLAHVGTVHWFYSKLSVAVVHVDERVTVRNGDMLEFTDSNGRRFRHTVNSMERSRKKIASTVGPDSVGIEVDRPVRQQTPVLLVLSA